MRTSLLVLSLVLASCSGAPTLHQPEGPPSPTGPFVTFDVTPARAAIDVPVSAEVIVAVANGTLTTMTLADAAGKQITGNMRSDNSAWIPDQALEYATKYTLTLTASGVDGKPVTETAEFTTMAKPKKWMATGLYTQSGNTYGVAMPIVMEFPGGVPQDARAAVQKRLFVTSDPPQLGAWHWASSTTLWYRPKEYWKTGTNVHFRSALGGLPIGDGRFGDKDRSAEFTIRGDRIEMVTDDSKHEMTVKKNGDVIKTLPVSLGKDSTPSSSGAMVIMQRFEKTIFDTTDEPDAVDLYRIEVDHAQRITWGGQFLHAAPWSVDDQGKRNVSHGCTNLSPANAEWLFGLTRIGDPVTVRGTKRQLKHGDGWTMWNMSWDNFIKGSAVPVLES